MELTFQSLKRLLAHLIKVRAKVKLAVARAATNKVLSARLLLLITTVFARKRALLLLLQPREKSVAEDVQELLCPKTRAILMQALVKEKLVVAVKG